MKKLNTPIRFGITISESLITYFLVLALFGGICGCYYGFCYNGGFNLKFYAII